jgi:DNA replication protein DnaC
MDPIDETLKKIAAATTKGNLPTSSSIDSYSTRDGFPGDPNCPICGGIGFVHQDLPLGHPDFGKLQLCTCRQSSVAQAIQQRLYRLSNLDAFKPMTFETFNPIGQVGLGENQVGSLKYALNQAVHFAQNLKGWLLLMGGYGCGKTHLAAAVANFAVNLGVPTLFLTVPDLLDWLRFSYDSPEATFEGRFDEIRNIPLLVLDDLGTQNATSWAQEKLYQIINHRYVSRLPMVVTTNQELDEIDGRIRSRLQDPELVTPVKINAPDFRSPMVDSTHPQLSTLHLHTGRTFGNFSLREAEKLPPDEQKSLEKAFRVAQQFSEKPHGWLVFSGDYGTGKTHLAAAIGNYRHSLGESPMFVVVPDLLDHLRSTFSPTSSVSYDSLFDQVKNCRLLILDDLGTQSATPWAREKLYQIFNYRYNAELPTVITTSSHVTEIDPRIRSRMLDKRLCEIFSIDVPPYRASAVSEKPKRTQGQTQGKKLRR